MSTAALTLALAVHGHTAVIVILVAFVVAAGLESVFAICLGCRVYAQLERIGVAPPCERGVRRYQRAPAGPRTPCGVSDENVWRWPTALRARQANSQIPIGLG